MGCLWLKTMITERAHLSRETEHSSVTKHRPDAGWLGEMAQPGQCRWPWKRFEGCSGLNLRKAVCMT